MNVSWWLLRGGEVILRRKSLWINEWAVGWFGVLARLVHSKMVLFHEETLSGGDESWGLLGGDPCLQLWSLLWGGGSVCVFFFGIEN